MYLQKTGAVMCSASETRLTQNYESQSVNNNQPIQKVTRPVSSVINLLNHTFNIT